MRERIENIQRVALKCVSFGICIPRIDLVPVGSPIGGKGFLVLRCLAWVATISVWKHEIEFGCEQVNHGFEVAD